MLFLFSRDHNDSSEPPLSGKELQPSMTVEADSLFCIGMLNSYRYGCHQQSRNSDSLCGVPWPFLLMALRSLIWIIVPLGNIYALVILERGVSNGPRYVS